MKKLLTLIVTAILCAAAFSAAACLDGGTGEGGDVVKAEIGGNPAIVLKAESGAFTYGGNASLADYLKVLKDNGKLTFEASDSQYGLYLTSLDGKDNVNNTDNTGYSWMLYLDFKNLEGDDSVYATDNFSVTYGDTVFYTSNNGISGTPCVEGHTYVFVYEAYDYGSFN